MMFRMSIDGQLCNWLMWFRTRNGYYPTHVWIPRLAFRSLFLDNLPVGYLDNLPVGYQATFWGIPLDEQ
jgi:hypothetical protein